nr:probably inactive leucine-rich repeat receptor-like protein kinase At5g48380 [Coffea arabica]
MALEKHVTRMSFEELSKATDDFHCMNIIGTGKLGTMYKAILQNGWFLAVKKLHNSYDFDQEFMSELMTIGRMRHCNFVPLIGFCYEINSRLLAYKYMSNGNLHDLLFSAQNGKVKCIEWPMSVKIAVGIARGLAWLHQVGVVHSSICSRCILLDHSCFGSAKLMPKNWTTRRKRNSGVNYRNSGDGVVDQQGDFKRWWTQISEARKRPRGMEHIGLTATILWQVWKERNKKEFENISSCSPARTIGKAQKEWLEQVEIINIKPSLSTGETTSNQEEHHQDHVEEGTINLDVATISHYGQVSLGD